MKKEKEVSSSVFNWGFVLSLVSILFWALISAIISGSISNFWMGIGGKYLNPAHAPTALIYIFGVISTLLVQAQFFNRLEKAARSYEDDVLYYINVRNDLLKRLNATVANLEMSDVDLLRSARLNSVYFNVGEINNYRTQLGNLPLREVRWALEEDRRMTQGKLNSLECPKEPINVARWRKHIMRQKESIANACA